MKKTIGLITLLILFSFSAHAEDQEILNDFELGRVGIEALLPLAAKGNALAQEYVGGFYEGVAENYAEAIKWLEKAAEQGTLSAMEQLIVLYHGNPVVKDDVEADKWFQALLKKAEAGDTKAQINLANMYERRVYVQYNLSQSGQWLLKAAKLGDLAAEKKIIEWYDKGYGLTKNTTEADFWTKEILKRAEKGEIEAQICLGEVYYGDSPRHNSAEALKWYLKAAAQGNVEAEHLLIQIYYWGEFSVNPGALIKNPTEGAKWLHAMVEQANTGNIQAELTLLDMLQSELSRENFINSETIGWLRTIAEKGNIKAQAILISIYTKGKEATPDPVQAAKWLKKLQDQASSKDTQAQLQLASIYGSRGDSAEQINWIQQAAADGSLIAQTQLKKLALQEKARAMDTKPTLVDHSTNSSLSIDPIKGNAPLTIHIKGPSAILERSKGFTNGIPFAGCLYDIDWGDQTSDPYLQNRASDLEHTYKKSGSYTVKASTWNQGPTDGPIDMWNGELVVEVQ